MNPLLDEKLTTIPQTRPLSTARITHYTPFADSGSYQTLGNSPATTAIKKIVNHQANKGSLRSDSNTEVTISSDLYGNKTISFKSKYTDNSDIEVKLENYGNIFSKKDKSTNKILNFILAESNAQNDPEDIIINIDDLVSCGIFSNRDTANKGLDRAMEKLTSLKLSGKVRKGNITTDNSLTVLFTNYRRVRGKGHAVISRNNKISMKVLTPFITLFPKWAYPLSMKAFMLLDYVMIQARQSQSYSKLANKGNFNISFNAINNHLGQPLPDDTKNPSRDIKEALLEAITEIEDMQKEAGEVEIFLTPCYDEKAGVDNFLNKGYLEVSFKGEVLNYFIDRNKSKRKKTAQNKKEN